MGNTEKKVVFCSVFTRKNRTKIELLKVVIGRI